MNHIPANIRRPLALTAAALLMLSAFLPWTWAQQAPAPAEQQPVNDAPVAEEPPVGETVRKVAIIRIEGDIYDFVHDSINRRIERARASGADHVVFEIDTYGGAVTSAIEICKYIKQLDLPTTAWVNDKAISAGSMIASACDQIVVTRNAVMGDSAPVVMGQELADTERAKALSPVLAEFRDNANDNGYDYALLHAMAELNIAVHEVRHKQTDRRRFVNDVDKRIMVDGDSPEEAVKSGWFGTGFMAKEDRRLEATVGAEERGQWEYVRQVHGGSTLLTLSGKELVDVNLARSAEIQTSDQLKAFLNAEEMIEIRQTWSEDIAGYLLHPMVRGILVLLVIVGAYAEMQAPGVGLPGALALIALMGLIAPPLIIGLAETWHLLALGLGVVLLAVELFVIPGFGVAGISGLILMLAGLVMMAVPTVDSGEAVIPLPTPEMWGYVLQSLLSMVGGCILGLIVIAILNYYFDTIPMFNRLVLKTQQPTFAGAVGSMASGNEEAVSIGDTGIVTTGLRPSGRAEINGQILDVVSRSTWIEPGRPIQVVKITGNQTIVDEVEG